MTKLKAINKIEDGSREGILPGEIFEIDDAKEATRLVKVGAAAKVETVSTEQPVKLRWDEQVRQLSTKQVKAGLDQLEIEYDPKAKLADLQQVLTEAGAANPIGAQAFLDSLEG
ncbi:MAG: hypothetical protein KDE62_04890 [Calditrichaeota bacterium]|nr:hypothetical protein [Calditrichota bacterium]